MKEYKNPQVEILKLTACDLLMSSGESVASAPDIDPLDQPNGTPPVSLF